MARLLTLIILLTVHNEAPAQLMVSPQVDGNARWKIRTAAEVPKALEGNTALRFEQLDVSFDGGSRAAFFKRRDGADFVIFFPNPGYWSPKAKRQSIQPVAIQGKTMVEIRPESPLQRRLLELLAHDIVDGKRDRSATLTLISIRDCLLHRKPLQEFKENYDPATWKLRSEQTGPNAKDPFLDH